MHQADASTYWRIFVAIKVKKAWKLCVKRAGWRGKALSSFNASIKINVHSKISSSRHEAVIIFCNLFEDVLDCLGTISTWRDINASAKASILLRSAQDSETLVALATLENVLSLTVGLSRALQAKDCDLLSGMSMAKSVIAVLQDRTNNDAFENVFQRATSKKI